MATGLRGHVQNVALEVGYNATAPASQQLQNLGVMSMSWANDMLTVLAAFKEKANAAARQARRATPQGGVPTSRSDIEAPDHCSGFVRLLPGNADLYVGHDTWAGLQSMLRIYKLYDMP